MFNNLFSSLFGTSFSFKNIKKRFRSLDKQLDDLPLQETQWKCQVPKDSCCSYDSKTHQWKTLDIPPQTVEETHFVIEAYHNENKDLAFYTNYKTLEDALKDFNSLKKALENFEGWWSPSPKLCGETLTVNLNGISYIDIEKAVVTYKIENGNKVKIDTKYSPCSYSEVVYDKPICSKKKKTK